MEAWNKIFPAVIFFGSWVGCIFWSTPPNKKRDSQLHRLKNWIVEWRLAGKKEVCILGCFSLATQRDPLRDPSFWWLGFTNFLFWRIDFSFDSNALGHYPNAIMHHVVETEERKTCAFLGKHRGACAFHPAHFVDQSQASFSSHGFLTKTVHQVKIECYWMLYIIYTVVVFWGSRFPLLLSLWSSWFYYIYILYTLSVPKNNQTIPKRRMFLEHKWVQHPWGESSKSTAGVGLTEIPTGGPQRLQARVLIHLTGGSGFLKYVFLRLHRVDRLVGDFHCPRDYIELMRLLSRKCKYRIHVDYEHMHLAPKSSYLRMQVWDHFVFECIFFNV